MTTLQIKRISENIKLARLSSDIAAEEFAKKCNIDYKSYSAYENGRKIPLEKLITICSNLDVSIDDIINRRCKIKIEFV